MKDQDHLITAVQEALGQLEIEAWLFYGFHNIDPIGLNILRFPPNAHISRRWFYLVPAKGEPHKLVHRIEEGHLDHLPGQKKVYLQWESLRRELGKLLENIPRVAMQYSHNNAIPLISRVDAGTVELIRSLGPEVVSSGDLIQLFDGVWSEDQIEQHRRTARALTVVVRAAFEKAAADIADRGCSDELAIQSFIMDEFSMKGLISDHPAIVGVNEHSGNPHYAPRHMTNAKLQTGDFLLIDLWAKPPDMNAVYADITWTAYFGTTPPAQLQRTFETVTQARDRGVEFLCSELGAGRSVEGWQVDDAVREVIRQAGQEEFFVHRTGHSLGTEVHGNGVNFDNLETHDTRRVIPGIACTIEPGIYRQNYGVRSEINVLVGEHDVEVTTEPQRELLIFDV